MEEYLGIQLERSGDTIRISKPLLIDRIIKYVPGMKNVNPVKCPVLPLVILTKDNNGHERK